MASCSLPHAWSRCVSPPAYCSTISPPPPPGERTGQRPYLRRAAGRRVDRLADSLEKLREELDELSHKIFHHRLGSRTPARNAERELQAILVTLGRDYDAISYLRDSQLGVARIAPYAVAAVNWMPKPSVIG